MSAPADRQWTDAVLRVVLDANAPNFETDLMASLAPLIEQVRADEREQTAALVKEIWEALEDVVNQAGGGPALLDSMALSAYADAMRLLAAHDRLVIDEEHGRRVIAHWPNKKDQT